MQAEVCLQHALSHFAFCANLPRMHKVFENSKPPRVDSLLKQVTHVLIIRNLNNGTWTGIGCIGGEFRAIGAQKPKQKMAVKKVKYIPNDRDVTIAEARLLANFKNASDGEVQHVLDSLKTYCTVVFGIISRKNGSGGKVLSLDPERKQAA